MCSINTFIFDLDGTLLDSVPDLAIALNRMLIAYNRSTYAENTIRQWVGNGARKLVERVNADKINSIKDQVVEMCKRFPVYK